MGKIRGGIRDGTMIKTIWESYFANGICHHIRAIFHMLYVLAQTFDRNRRNETSFTAYVGTAAIWLAILTVSPIQYLNDALNVLLNAMELIVEIVSAIVMIPLTRTTYRTEHVNTVLFHVESLTGIEFQKTIYEVSYQPRKGRICTETVEGQCFQRYRLGSYWEVDFSCAGCLQDFSWYKEHAAVSEGFEHLSVRGTIVSELTNIFCRRSKLGTWLEKQNTNGVIVYRECDVRRYLWKVVKVTRQTVNNSDETGITVAYKLKDLRTDILQLTVPWNVDNVRIVQSYCEVCELQNKYIHFNKTRNDILYLKAVVSLLLFVAQLVVEITNNLVQNSITPSLLTFVIVQIAWLQVISDLILNDEGSVELDNRSMRKISVNRMCSIFYLAHGDQDRKYDGSNCSWMKAAQSGDFDLMPIHPLECLLGGDHLVTALGAWSLNRSGAAIEKREVSSDGGIWKVEEDYTFGNPDSSVVTLVPGLVG